MGQTFPLQPQASRSTYRERWNAHFRWVQRNSKRIPQYNDGETHWYVLHAEANAITKVAKSTNNAKDSTLYITLSPCKDCCKLILQAGIKRLVYKEEYKDNTAITFLKTAGIEVVQIAQP